MATATRDDDARRAVRGEFDDAVNVTAAQLRRWLDTVSDTKWRHSLVNWGHDPPR